mgnify:CR=1 FL=1
MLIKLTLLLGLLIFLPGLLQNVRTIVHNIRIVQKHCHFLKQKFMTLNKRRSKINKLRNVKCWLAAEIDLRGSGPIIIHKVESQIIGSISLNIILQSLWRAISTP